MNPEDVELTIEQKELLYLISRLTDHHNCPDTWVKETPLQALMFHAIRKGLFNDYDYAPISSSFLGQGRKFVNISKEGEDDLGDLRELGLLETIRLSSTKYDYITGYRPTTESAKQLSELTNEIKSSIDTLFDCPECNEPAFNLVIDVGSSSFFMKCKSCSYNEDIPLVEPEDVSYSTKAYFFKSLGKHRTIGEDNK